MFIDQARIYVKAGDGGNGVVAFRREKYVAAGGPSGGDGGGGGDVIFEASSHLSTLADFRYKRHYKAEPGGHGQNKNMHGKNGKNLVVRIPCGTLIRDGETGTILADMIAPHQQIVLVRGGRGGRGNARFANAREQVPTLAEKGEPGEERWIELELKLLADVGLVGFPNVGKSTLISSISEAKPKIAGYPFTTLEPVLGVVELGENTSFVVADIPGLIEGAHQGVGLGHEFLRHVERTRLLVHVIDAAGTEGRDVMNDFNTISRELEMYSPGLANRRQVLAANKIDLPAARENLAILREQLGSSYEIYPVSAVTGEGIPALVNRLGHLLAEMAGKEEAAPVQVQVRHELPAEVERFKVTKEDGLFMVTGKEVERHVAMTDLENEAAVRRLQNIFERMGVEAELRALGAKTGDTVRIREVEFEYLEGS